MLPILYSFRRCPYAMRARLAIVLSGVQVELREVLLRDKPKAMLEASPKGTVPVLVNHDGAVIEESLDIMLWALSQGKNVAYWQSLSDSRMHDALRLVETCDDHFKPALDRYKYWVRYPEASKQTYRDEAMHYLNAWDARLRRQGYLLGHSPSLADIAIFPFVRQFAFADKDGFDRCELPALQAWLEEWLVSPLLASVMEKYAQWAPQVTMTSETSGIIFPE